jgi:tRNA(Ile)-lysidine synthase
VTTGLDPAVAAVRHAVRDALADVEPGAQVLVACSGGADSMALADAAVFEGRHAGWLVGAVTVDHRLQPGSDKVAEDVAVRLASLGCDPVRVAVTEVVAHGGPEAAARTARYAELERVAVEYDATVLLGHTLDDQAETVLLGLARGSGTRSLSGMAPVTGRFRRPLLGIRREQTRRACQAAGLPTWDDPHNDDETFSRVRVRRRLLPALEATLGPGMVEALARTASAARRDADLLDDLAADVFATASGADGLDADVLAGAPSALRTRVLRVAALQAGCPATDLFAVHVDEMERLVTDWHGQGPLTLPGGVRAARGRGKITFTTAAVGR